MLGSAPHPESDLFVSYSDNCEAEKPFCFLNLTYILHACGAEKKLLVFCGKFEHPQNIC